MIIYKRCRAMAVVLFVLISLAGCGRRNASEKVVASINDYRMTVEDFNYESKEILNTGKFIGEIPVTKDDVLEALIVKELLLQEAQKWELDKDKRFMKTIELYWEQTLIRNLLAEKSRKIENSITVYETEIADFYNKMKETVKAKVLMFGNEKSARKLLKYQGDAAEHAENESEKYQLLYVIPSRTYTLGEDNSPLEYSIFEIGSNKERELVRINGKWALVIVEERALVHPKPLHSIKSDIAKNIRKRKERERMNEWIESLRSKARIRINRSVLEELP